jgi:hypothetical protein
MNVQNLSVQDNMIYLNNGNYTANPDLGFAGNYNDGTYHHSGFFRDSTDGVWKVFDNYEPEPDASPYIDTSNSTFHIANFQANTIFVGNTTVYSTINTTSYTGTANNATYLVASTSANLVYNSSASGWQSNVNFVPAANNLGLGNTSSLWNLYANTINANGSIGASSQILTSNGSGSFWKDPSPKYVNMVQTGTIFAPYTGSSRYYPPTNINISTVYASISTVYSNALVFKIFKNGADTGYTFTINSGVYTLTPVSVNISLSTTDYLTLNLVSGSSTELKVQLQYT